MLIADFEADTEFVDAAELTEFLRRRYARNENCFSISDEFGTYPQMHIMVVGDKAVLHFYRSESSPILQSRATTSSHQEGETVFWTDITDQEEPIPNTSVVSASDAECAAVQFFETHSRPTAINWEELALPGA